MSSAIIFLEIIEDVILIIPRMLSNIKIPIYKWERVLDRWFHLSDLL